MALRTIDGQELSGKHVLLRVDFNVPLQAGKITDETRMLAALPTIRYILENGAALIIMSHLGRPTEAREPQFSLNQLRERLAQLSGTTVAFCEEAVGSRGRSCGTGPETRRNSAARKHSLLRQARNPK